MVSGPTCFCSRFRLIELTAPQAVCPIGAKTFDTINGA
jgi:hypothetical protein